MRFFRGWAIGVLAASLLGAGGGARANVFESFGFGPRGVSMADALTAEANDYTAVWYNPAMLVTRKDLNFGFSFNYQRIGTSVTAQDPSQQNRLDCAYCTPPDTVGYSLGLLFPLGGKVKDRVAIGLGIYLPSEVLLRTQAPDPNRPFWYQYTGNPERIVVVVAVGIKLTDKLNVGIGAQALADLVGSGATVKVDLFSKSVAFREIDSHLANRAGPVAGVMFQPIPQLRLGASFRSEMELVYSIPASVDLSGLGTLDFQVSGITDYSPHTFNAGVAFDATPDLTFTIDGNYQMWSRAPSPYMNLTVQLSGQTLHALGLDTAFDLASPKTPPGFKDTVSARAGVEYRVNDRFAARGGVFYRPTPVPKQDAPQTNILDADALGAALGAGVAFSDPLEVFQAPIKIDAAVQGALLLGRAAGKDLTDSVPSYNYSGKTFGLTIGVRYDF